MMIPHHGRVIRETIFSSVPLATPSSLSWALEGLFELQGPSVSIPVRFRSTEIQGHCGTQHMSSIEKLKGNFCGHKKEGHFHYKNFLRALK